MRWIHSICLLAGFGLILISFNGCGSRTETAAPSIPDINHEHDDEDISDHDHPPLAETGHDHSGWWCVEHGVPEGECALCDTSLVAGFKEAGDWCDQHNRPESQCFQCDPERFDKFAARYEAKFGEQPPKPTE